MSLIDDVKKVCDRLAPLGWRDLLLAVTDGKLDIAQGTSTGLGTALTQTLASIDRRQPGFEDFHRTANQAITGGRPSHSLLYHALASPNVHPTSDGKVSTKSGSYPTLEELDVVENYIYSLMADRSDLKDTFVAVFAYQYRVASRTSHRRHADIAYSRTGIARVGTAGPNYDPSRRSHWVLPENDNDGIAVLPARYAVFLARLARPGAAGSVQGGSYVDGDRVREFVFPVHKLFGGTECVAGSNLSIDFLEYHCNEKLRRAHRIPTWEGGLPVPRGFDTSITPYVRDSRNGGDLVTLEAIGSSVLVAPKPASALVRTVTQMNTVTHTEQVVYFMVPKHDPFNRIRNRIIISTLAISSSGDDRLAPEYVNISHQVDPKARPNQIPKGFSAKTPKEFERLMRDGGYPAAHFADDSCDGAIEGMVTGLPSPIAQRGNAPAFSLVTAPDFMPLADQLEVETEATISLTKPLSKGRLPANLSLPLPSDPNSFAFDKSDESVTAVIGELGFGQAIKTEGYPNRMVSYLPDAASDVFAPGWDTSRSRNDIGSFLTSWGLGSPFPEDAKLCAALASYWPAVAPDNGRTFGNEEGGAFGLGVPIGNKLPMLDEELGFHKKHRRVKSGELKSYRGWDGEYGPFFEEVDGKFYVNYVAIERSDYVAHALAGRINISLTAEVQSEELIIRRYLRVDKNRFESEL